MQFLRMRSRKGFFFVIDSIMAIVILSIGIYMILSSYMVFADRDQTALTSRSLLSFMDNVTIASYDSDYKFEELMGLSGGGNYITRYDNSLSEQLGEFFFRDRWDLASGLAGDIVEKVVPQQFEAEILVKEPVSDIEETIYERNTDPSFSSDDSRLVVPYKSIVMGDFESEDGSPEPWGPYVIEVRVWQ